MIVGEREALEQLSGAEKLSALFRAQAGETGGELRDPSPAPLVQEPPSFSGGGYSPDALVARIRFAAYETLALQVLDEARDRRWAYLLGGGELAHRYRASEDDDGKSRQARGGEPGGAVLASEFSNQVDGGRMETIGKLEILLRFDLTWLFGHRIFV